MGVEHAVNDWVPERLKKKNSYQTRTINILDVLYKIILLYTLNLVGFPFVTLFFNGNQLLSKNITFIRLNP